MSDFTSDQPGHSALHNTKHMERSFEGKHHSSTADPQRAERGQGLRCRAAGHHAHERIRCKLGPGNPRNNRSERWLPCGSGL